MQANWAGDDDDEPPDVILDGEGRVYGSGAACDCSIAVFDGWIREIHIIHVRRRHPIFRQRLY